MVALGAGARQPLRQLREHFLDPALGRGNLVKTGGHSVIRDHAVRPIMLREFEYARDYFRRQRVEGQGWIGRIDHMEALHNEMIGRNGTFPV